MSEERITIEKPEKNPKRIEAGKKLAAFNKMAKKKKESGNELNEPEHYEESTCENDKEEMGNITKILLLAGAAGLGYYIYTTTNNSGPQQQQQQQPITQNNNEVQENTVSKLRTFKN